MFAQIQKQKIFSIVLFFTFIIVGGLLANTALANTFQTNFNVGETGESSDRLFPQSPSRCTFACFRETAVTQAISSGQCEGKYLQGNLIEFTRTIEDALAIEWQETCNGDPVRTVALQDNIRDGLIHRVDTLAARVVDQRPASGIRFAEEKVYALQSAFSVNAQQKEPGDWYYPGTGFDLLGPIQGLWGWSVNVVYGILIFLIIGVAFGIMFRARLDGGTAVTIQNAIPNIALAMILVPLSYAISGLFIDAITVGTNVAHEFLIGGQSPVSSVYTLRNCSQEVVSEGLAEGKSPEQIVEENIDGACSPTEGGSSARNDIDRGLFPDDDRLTWFNSRDQVEITSEISALIASSTEGDGFATVNNSSSFINGVVNLLGGDQNGGNAWMGEIINFFFSLLLLLTGLRILWKLIIKYTYLLIFPFLSPFLFATVAIPGNGWKSISELLRFMGSASIAFIVTYAMFLVSIILSSAAFQGQLAAVGTNAYIPPLFGGIEGLIGIAADANFDIYWVSVFMAFMGIVVYLNIPPVLDSIDEALDTKFFIQKIFTNAWTSAKDSVNLAQRGVSGAQRGAAGANTLRKAPGELQNRARSFRYGVNNWRDARRGIRAGEQGSFAYRENQKLLKRKRELDQKRMLALQRGGPLSGARAAAYAQEISNIDRQLESLKTSGIPGTEIGKLTDDLKTGKLAVDITFAGNGGPITLQGGTWEQLSKGQAGELLDKKENNKFTWRGGKLVLKATDFKFSPAIVERIRIVMKDAIKSNAARRSDSIPGVRRLGGKSEYVKYREQLDNSLVDRDTKVREKQLSYTNRLGFGLYEFDPTLLNKSFIFKDSEKEYTRKMGKDAAGKDIPIGWTQTGTVNQSDIVEIKFDDNAHQSPNSDGSEWEISFALQINDVQRFLKYLVPGKLWQTNKVAFTIVDQFGNEDGNITSDPIDIKLQTFYTPVSGAGATQTLRQDIGDPGGMEPPPAT